MHEHHTDSDHDHDGHKHDDHDHGEHSEHEHDHEHKHDENAHGGHGHGHEHGRVDADLYGNREGLRAVQISTAGMFLVAAIQFIIAFIGGSAGLFADALHNLCYVLTTVALWIAFVLSNRAANRRYTYGYYRSEDLAGIFIVLVIIASAVAGAVESIQKLTSGSVPTQLYLSMAAALVGVAGNELLAQYKISVGKRINSVPLIADPIAGIVITIVIVTVVFSTSRSVLQRLLDAVDPRVVPSIINTAIEVPGVEEVTDVRARWIGHTMHVVMNIEVDAELTLAKAHAIAEEVRHRLFHSIKGLSEDTIHTDPSSASGDHHSALAHHIQEAQRPVVRR